MQEGVCGGLLCVGGQRAGLARPLPARGAAPALASSGQTEGRDGGQRGWGWGGGEVPREINLGQPPRRRERSGGSRPQAQRQRLCGRRAGGLVREPARVSEQVNGEERGGRLGAPWCRVLRAEGGCQEAPGGKDRGTGSGKGTERGAERCQGGMWGGRRLASAGQVSVLTPVSLHLPCPVPACLSWPLCRAGSTMDCSCVSDLLFAPPALPALWTPGNWPAPSPTPAPRPSQRPLLVSPSPSRGSVRLS